MAQVSYGTITITDTNDIERIYTVYAKSNTNIDVPTAAASSWKESVSEAPGTGNYIWQRTVVQKSGTQEKVYSDPVCLTGEEGEDGRGIFSITIKYGTSADWNTQPSNWYDNTPEYSSSTPNYWTQTTISYTSGNPTVKVTQDKALTQAVSDSAMANSIAQSANENANGAMGQAASNVNSVTRLWWSQATATPVPNISTIITDGAANRRGAWSNIRPTDDEAYPYYFYCDQTITGGGVASWSTVTLDTSTLSKYEIIATNVRTQNFFKGQDTTYDGWFASGRSSDNGLKENDAETYYYNARFGATHIALGYNKTPVIDLDGSNGTINIYRFPTIDGTSKKVTSAGALGMKLSATDLNFYNTNGVVTSSFGDSISLASNGAAITIGSTSSYNTYIDSQGLSLRNGTTANATLDSNGLVLNKGGIIAGGGNNLIYLSTEGYPLYGEVVDGVTSNGFTINNHTPSVNSSGNNDPAWKQIVGTKFGVDSEGNLYASDVKITGHIEATSGYLSTGVRIGNANGPHISIEDSMIVFWKGEEKDSQEQIIETNKSAYITGEYMYIPYTVVLNEMVVGEREPAVGTDKPIRLWSWRKMSNENLRLVWMGGED